MPTGATLQYDTVRFSVHTGAEGRRLQHSFCTPMYTRTGLRNKGKKIQFCFLPYEKYGMQNNTQRNKVQPPEMTSTLKVQLLNQP